MHTRCTQDQHQFLKSDLLTNCLPLKTSLRKAGEASPTSVRASVNTGEVSGWVDATVFGCDTINRLEGSASQQPNFGTSEKREMSFLSFVGLCLGESTLP